MTRTDVIPAAKVAAQKFKLMSRSEYSRTALGQTIVKNLGSALWFAEWTSRDMKHDIAINYEAIVWALDDGIDDFYAYDVRRPYPLLYPKGDFVDSGQINSVNVDNKHLSLKLLPAAFTLSRGDYLAFDYSDVDGNVCRALHQIIDEVVVADGVGTTAEFEVRPFLRPTATNDTPVTLKKPSAKFKMIPGSFDPSTVNILQSSGSLQAVQSI